MIEAVKKRYNVGDTITIHTAEASFTGRLDAFEETCVIIITEEGEEFISNEDIKRVSVPKKEGASVIASATTEIKKLPKTEENEVPKVEIKPQPIEAKLPLPQYKVGDKIPLEVLEERTDKKSKPQKIKTKSTITLGSLSDLSQLILPEVEAENKKTVPANGVIKSNYFVNRGFGFLFDKFGNEIWFSLSSIIDDDLYKALTTYNSARDIPVLFTLSKNVQGNKAINIQKPKLLEEVLLLSKKYFEGGNIEIALGLLEQILSSFPDNYSALKLKEKIEDSRKRNKNYYQDNKPYNKSYDINFQKGQKAHIGKNYKTALDFYMLAFENKAKRESCIKNISMLYLEWDKEEAGKLQKGIEFLEKHEKELPRNSSTYFFLENYYGKSQKFEKQIKNIDLLLDIIDITDKNRYPFLLAKKAFGLFQLNKLEESRELLEEIISIQPHYTYATRLLKLIDEPDSEDAEQFINEAEFWSFGSGISQLIKDSLENCEFKGLRATVIEKGEFNKGHLNEIRELIKDAGAGRPTDRADYLLTEAKLLEILEPNNEKGLNNVLIRFCNTKAFASIQGKLHLDVVRHYFLEAFSLEESWDETEWDDDKQYSNDSLNRSTINSIASYLWSFKATYAELLTNQLPPLRTILDSVFTDANEYVWHSVSMMFLNNRLVTSKIVSKLYKNQLLRKHSLSFLKSQLIEIPSDLLTIDEYVDLWNKFTEKRQREFNKWFAITKSLSKSTSLESIVNLANSNIGDLKQPWLTQYDQLRLKTISDNIFDEVTKLIRLKSFPDQESSYNSAKAQINQLVSEIKEQPTKFSFEGLIPLLERVNFLLEKYFDKIIDASTPKIKISILNEDSLVDKGNIVPCQILISNSPECSPIWDTKISILENPNIKQLEGTVQHFDSIKGGNEWIFKLIVQVSDKILNDKATTLNVQCEYKIRNQEEPISTIEQLSLRLYSEDEFEDIDNPYAPIADGGPVENKKMFFGRDEFINNRITAILNADSKQIIIYGQKRSGKSSVLYHLKRGLEETNNSFCVSFSLGLIIKDLNEFTFYHKILSSIERELKLRKAKGENVPIFSCPTLDEFKTKHHTNPANGFIELIEDFKIASMEVEGWVNKKLIIMIDEFTYLYTAIRSGTTSETIMKQWKAITQSENAKLSVVLVGQDVVPSFKKEDYAKNAFGVIEDIRLTYLDEVDAKKLIEEPLLDKNGQSRFIGKAVDTIIEYTSRNPYYIQIFCSRLVDYMNAKKVIKVTEADIKDVAETFIEGGQALAPEKFDNLIRAGEEHDFKEFDDEPIIKILRQIAIGSKNIGICSRDNISINDKALEDKILAHLSDREVLEKKQGDNYKIQVKLFQEWLLRH